ncbi:hypothetical protein PBCV1_a065L [Paramecium bursaria Chlorella virus 1]|uniref:Uncharacterized protein n=1 Tax=Paramecium bursaria Chlorella virus 1 TaxID=10506 RepID=Q89400_PBCV1|nr:hypothetical protein PBCV1_a065L [Paramecium bursaria Chlorella virus 1]AAC96433.1 hypothetical protein [Paramecium bursaria Chlorella virus 1]
MFRICFDYTIQSVWVMDYITTGDSREYIFINRFLFVGKRIPWGFVSQTPHDFFYFKSVFVYEFYSCVYWVTAPRGFVESVI